MDTPCIEPGCPNLATYRGRCQEHARRNDLIIDRAGHKLYRTKRWLLTRKRVLLDQPICAIDGCERLATQVDHIIPLPEGPAYDRANMQGLCAHHHGLKTKRERGTTSDAPAR